MKSRLTSLDIRAICNELNERLVNKYIQNFYSKQQRFTYIKFANKDILLIEPGYTLFLYDSHDIEISHFCKKLREKCRHAKVQRIYQSGFDRVIIIDIKRYKIVIEMFSNGNIIILDDEDNIVDLQRPVEALGMVKKSKYVWNSVDLELSYDVFLKKSLEEILFFENEFVEKVKEEIKELVGESEEWRLDKNKEKIVNYLDELKNRVTNIGWFGEVYIKKGKAENLYSFPRQKDKILIIESVMLNKKLTEFSIKEKINNVKNIYKDDSKNIIENNDNKSNEDKNNVEVNNESNNKINVRKLKYWKKEEANEFLKSHKSYNAYNFEMFNEAVAFCFCERQKNEKIKVDKTERITNAQQSYIKELECAANIHNETAELLERNRKLIENIFMIFKNVYEKRIRWNIFEEFWESEKELGNLYAKAILSFDLKQKRAIIEIEENIIELELDISINANIDKFYSKRKKALDKAKKTAAAMNISKNIVKKKIGKKCKIRVPYWFEKYNFFFSSEKHLVIGGKNGQENEIVVKTYLKNEDVYLHCDVQGGSSVICKSRSEKTIEEASWMALCYSKCWEEGIVRDVFSVMGDQVSKTPPSGEFIVKGSFIINGKKTFFRPYKLEYGIGLLFKEEESEPLEFEGIPTGKLIIHAMPVCAPWNVIKEYKYSARLCPGNEKKSQIAKKLINIFTQKSEGFLEEPFVSSISIDEYIKVILNKAKIAKTI